MLVNPAAAQILGYRASDLGGRELHTLVLHSRADGSPFPYEESPLADTLRSGRKHRVRGQVLWSKSGDKVPVDLTTAPVRDGEQLVGAVMTFTDRRPYEALAEEKKSEAAKHAEEIEKLTGRHTQELEKLREQHIEEFEKLREQRTAELSELTERHEEELAAGEERYAALGEREKDRYEALAARHEQLLAVLGHSLRGPLDQLRGELGKLAADDAGQLWPEANQVLHHLTAGYSRITTLVDNVLGYQRLDSGDDDLVRTAVDARRGRRGRCRRGRRADRARDGCSSPCTRRPSRPRWTSSGSRRHSPISSRTWRGSTRQATRPSRPVATWTTRSSSPPRSAVRSSGSRCAGRTPGETRCTSRSCAGSCGHTAVCCRRTRCRG